MPDSQQFNDQPDIESVRLGSWIIQWDRHLISSPSGRDERRVEPKVMALLRELVHANNQLVSRQYLIRKLWGDTVVGEDTLARTVSRLRNVLDDSAEQAQYIETVPKRGYRLVAKCEPVKESAFRQKGRRLGLAAIALASVICVVLVLSLIESPDTSEQSVLLQRANDYYMRFNRADNEAAIELYQKALLSNPNDPVAQSGLANGLVQRLIRWPEMANVDANGQLSLADALSSGQLNAQEAQTVLSRAVGLAERAAREAPQDVEVLKTLGFTYSASGRLEDAAAVYQRAITFNPDAWRSLINLGELHLIWGNQVEAIRWFEQAFHAMRRSYSREPQHIGPWQPSVGVLVAQLHYQTGNLFAAESWYRKVLELAPFEPQATKELAALLRQQGDELEANRLCETLQRRTGVSDVCVTGGLKQ